MVAARRRSNARRGGCSVPLLAERATDMMREPQGRPRAPGPGLGRLPTLGRERPGSSEPWRSGPAVHQGLEPPGTYPSCVILCANSRDGLSERVKFYRSRCPDAPPVVVFGPQLDLPLARDALQAGASGFVHAEMMPDQLVRALAVAAEGELVAPTGAAWVRVDR